MRVIRRIAIMTLGLAIAVVLYGVVGWTLYQVVKAVTS